MRTILLAAAIVLCANLTAFADRPVFSRSVRVERSVSVQRARGPIFAWGYGLAMARSARIDHRAAMGR